MEGWTVTHSALTNQIRLSSQNSSRNGTKIDTFLVHHQAGTNDDATINAMVSGSKEVSANYTISNEGRLTLVVDEDFRAWTSGSSTDGGRGAQWDRRSITVEIENETGAPAWLISDAAVETAAKLLVDLRDRYGVAQVYGHRDLWNLFQASYATFCPGPETVGRIVARANELANGGFNAGGGQATPGGNTGAGIDYAYGLSKDAQLALQKRTESAGLYTGILDGVFGAMSVKATQQWLKNEGLLSAGYTVDGVPGPVYGKALQTFAKRGGYSGPIDGAPGAATSAGIVKALGSAPAPTPPAPAPSSDWQWTVPDTAMQARIQRALKARGRYNGPVDGSWGANTIKGIQTTIKNVGYTGPADGVPGKNTCYYVQVYGQRFGSYAGPVDAKLGPNSWAAFALGLERP